MGKQSRLSDQIRRAIDDSGMSRYLICHLARIDKGLMSRFMSGKSNLSLNALERLADVLNLRVVADKRQRKGR